MRSLCAAREGQRWTKPFFSPQDLSPQQQAEVLGKMPCSCGKCFLSQQTLTESKMAFRVKEMGT